MTDVETSATPFPRPSRVFEHLSCFLPGLLTLGAHTLSSTGDLTAEESERHQWAAEGLANTCWVTYADHVSGLGPDEMKFIATDFVFDDPDTQAYVSQASQENKTEGLMMGRWMDHVREWENAGRPGDLPPGIKDPQPVLTGQRDYVNTKSGYLLRPEVRSQDFMPSSILLTLHMVSHRQ